MSEKPSFLSYQHLIDVLSLTETATAVHVGEQGTIQFANKAMLKIWDKDNAVIGKTLEEALPELNGQPFIDLFAKAWKEGITVRGFDAEAQLMVDGILRTYYFDFEYKAIKNDTGEVTCILHSATDVTERFLNKVIVAGVEQNIALLKHEQFVNEKLLASNEEITAINEELSRSREELSHVNIALEYKVEERVKAFAESEERFRTMAEGTEVLIAVSGADGKAFYFNKAWTLLTGKTLDELTAFGWVNLLHADDKEKYIEIHKKATVQKLSYTDDFRILGADGKYHWMLKKGSPRFFSNGTFAGYISSCVDITTRKEIECKLQLVYEELAVKNAELSITNKDLIASIKELEQSNAELQISELRFKNIITQAPFGICVIRAKDLMVTEVNNEFLALIGRSRAITQNQPIWQTIPEIAGAYAPILKKVIDTGIAFRGQEHEVQLQRNGNTERMFLDFVYEPVKNLLGNVGSVMVVAVDITEKVLARKSIEDVEERIRLAVESAEIGTYEYNYSTKELTSTERFRQIFGLEGCVTRDEVIATYHPLDVHLSNHSQSLNKDSGKMLYETRLILKDGAQHWARIQGQAYFDAEGVRTKLLGTVLDITEYKRLQQQKDDFISIASHELKTPITTLKASLQLLERMKDSPSSMFPKLIEQSSRSVIKVSELVEDLLNVSKMKEGQIVLKKTQFVAADLLNQCCSSIRTDGSQTLMVLGDETLEVLADENRIEQVIINFLNNALKYGSDSVKIFLKVEQVTDHLLISIIDDGPGISAEKLPHLFDRYFRVDDTGAQISGLGLGLYISADIVARHNGKIGVNSELGKGSTFWFTLPSRII